MVANIKNIDKAIAIMKRAKNLDMDAWQGMSGKDDSSNIARSEDELHACGNTACFGGYIAISPEFKADGGYVAPNGAPVLGNLPSAYPELSLAAWLGISENLASNFMHGDLVDGGFGDENEVCLFYAKPWSEVTAEDVIAKLEELKAHFHVHGFRMRASRNHH